MALLILSISFCIQLFDFSTGYVNLAVNKPAWQTTNYSPTCCLAAAAVDGDKQQTISSGSCALIKKTNSSGEWRVDLGEVLRLHHIKIYYRNEGQVNTWRMAGFFLFVSNTTSKEDGHTCFHEVQTSPPPNPMTITCIQNARYVIYYNERNGFGVNYPSSYSASLWNELCEVEVFGCDNTGFHGENCNKTCPSNCKNKYCEVVNGNCFSCLDGYQGHACGQACSDFFYGEKCGSICGHCLNGVTCNHIDGTCVNGCAEGWKGSTCNTVCTPGTYGFNCNMTCNVNCYSNTSQLCHRVNGICTTGCQSGWQGSHCDRVCDNHYYGANCALGCGKCLNRRTCNHVNGTCSNGCETGWEGDKCYSECTPGTFGLGCNYTCSKTCYGNTNDLCHPETGNCNNGCLPGWQGDHCSRACDDFFYGARCSVPCGRCFNGEKCNHHNGVCENGCEAGVQGNLCDKLCDPGKYGQGCNQSCNENCNGTRNTCDPITGECKNGCAPGWKGGKCDTDADTVDSNIQPQEMAQSNNFMTEAIVGWVFVGILIVFFITILILYKLRKSDQTKANRQIYDDVNMDRRDETNTYSSLN